MRRFINKVMRSIFRVSDSTYSKTLTKEQVFERERAKGARGSGGGP